MWSTVSYPRHQPIQSKQSELHFLGLTIIYPPLFSLYKQRHAVVVFTSVIREQFITLKKKPNILLENYPINKRQGILRRQFQRCFRSKLSLRHENYIKKVLMEWLILRLRVNFFRHGSMKSFYTLLFHDLQLNFVPFYR